MVTASRPLPCPLPGPQATWVSCSCVSMGSFWSYSCSLVVLSPSMCPLGILSLHVSLPGPVPSCVPLKLYLLRGSPPGSHSPVCLFWILPPPCVPLGCPHAPSSRSVPSMCPSWLLSPSWVPSRFCPLHVSPLGPISFLCLSQVLSPPYIPPCVLPGSCHQHVVLHMTLPNPVPSVSLSLCPVTSMCPSTCPSKALSPPCVPPGSCPLHVSLLGFIPFLCCSQVLSPPCVPPKPCPLHGSSWVLSPPWVPLKPCPFLCLSWVLSPPGVPPRSCPPHPWPMSPVGVEDLEAIDVEDTDDGALAMPADVIASGGDAGIDASHNPAEKPLIDGLGTSGTGWWAPEVGETAATPRLLLTLAQASRA